MFKSIQRSAILMGLGIIAIAASGAFAEETQNLQVGAKVRATVVSASPEQAPAWATLQRVNYSQAKVKATPKKIQGTLLNMDETTITLETSPNNPPVQIRRLAVSKLEVSNGKKSRGTGALVGLGAGAAMGALMGGAGGDDPPGIMSMSAGAKAGMGAVVFGLVGAIVGTAITPGDKWETVQNHKPQLGFSKGAHGETGLILSARF